MSVHIGLWNSPYNGGWVYFDRKQMLKWKFMWIKDEYRLYFSLVGICGNITLQTWPWEGRVMPKHHR